MSKLTNLLFFLSAVLFVAACHDKGKVSADVAFQTTTLTYADSTANASVGMKADFPTAGPDFLCDSVAQFINSTLGSEQTDIRDGQQMLDFYGKALLSELQQMYNDFNSNSDDERVEIGMYNTTTIKLTDNEARYISYTVENESYEGGAHGFTLRYGVTFNKQTGAIERSLLKDTDSEAFRKLLVAGLLHYFSMFSPDPLTDEDQLADMLLIDNLKELMLPAQNMPCLSKEGVVITYSPYEIAPYAAGIPSFTIPFSDVRKYMTTSAQQLISEE